MEDRTLGFKGLTSEISHETNTFTAPAYIVIKAANEVHDKTTAINEMLLSIHSNQPGDHSPCGNDVRPVSTFSSNCRGFSV